MRKKLPLVLPALLAIGVAGCGWRLPWGSRKPPSAREVLGVDDERFKELDEASLDAELSRPRNGLRLTIRTDKHSYAIGEPVIVDVRLENVTTLQGADKARDVPVYFEPVAYTRDGRVIEWLFKFEFRSEPDARPVYRSRDVKIAEDARENYYHYVVLPPHSFVGRRFTFHPSRLRALTRPGRYSILASYAVGEDSADVILHRRLTAQQVEMLGKLAYLRVWTGQVYSNRATFQVKRKKILGIF